MTLDPKSLIIGTVLGLLAMYGYLFASNTVQVAKINGTIEAITKLAPDCIRPFQQEALQSPHKK